MNTFLILAFCSFLGVVAVVAGIVVYLKKSGALTAAKDAAADVVKKDVTDALTK